MVNTAIQRLPHSSIVETGLDYHGVVRRELKANKAAIELLGNC